MDHQDLRFQQSQPRVLGYCGQTHIRGFSIADVDDAGAATPQVREKLIGSSNVTCPMLTPTNYTVWAMRMKVVLRIHKVWITIDPGSEPNEEKDCLAMGLLYQAIPENLILQIGNQNSAKQLWEAVKSRNVGADRVKEARLQTLMSEFDRLKMSESESIDSYAGKLSGIASKSAALGETIYESKMIVASLEQVLDLKSVGFEDVVGRLKAYEERIREDDGGDEQQRVMFTSTGGGWRSGGGTGSSGASGASGGKKTDRENDRREGFNSRGSSGYASGSSSGSGSKSNPAQTFNRPNNQKQPNFDDQPNSNKKCNCDCCEKNRRNPKNDRPRRESSRSAEANTKETAPAISQLNGKYSKSAGGKRGSDQRPARQRRPAPAIPPSPSSFSSIGFLLQSPSAPFRVGSTACLPHSVMKSKQLSGYQKLKKRKLLEEQKKADFGALHKFFVTQPVDDAHIEENIDDHIEEHIDDHVEEQEDIEVEHDHVEEQKDVEVEQAEEQEPIVDIYDPRMWDKLNSEEIKLLVEKGPKRDTSIEYGPYDTHGRRFAASLYTRILPNLEKCDREWLVYSIELDKLFCFCCKLLKRGMPKNHCNSEDEAKEIASETIDTAISELNKLIEFFQDYRETGFSKAIDEAKEIASDMGVDPVFPQRRLIQRKKRFDESSSSEVSFTAEENFRVHYFIYIVDKATSSLEIRFQQFKEYDTLFGFLFPHNLRGIEDKNLKSSCHRLEKALRFEIRSDIDAEELYMELKLFETLETSELSNPIDVLKFMKELDYFPNACIAYSILLTIPVTVASAERSFSKLKLLKSYLRSTMTQERLSGLATISIENEILESINYEELINQFAIKNARRASRIIG
ncbi:hypothetical protein LXL04_000999 [Taraxacum kok-saghyz]